MKSMIIHSLLLALPAAAISQTKQFLLTGTYTSGSSKGIYVYDFNSKTGEAVLKSETVNSNPSYLAVSARNKFIYAVNEEGDNKGSVSAFAFDQQNGTLTPLNQQLTMGDHPCYVDVDKTGHWVAVANYSGGNFSVFKVNEDGSLQSASVTVQHEGQGGDKSRQEKPHVHSTVFSPDNKYLLVQDLGIDKIVSYPFDEKTGKVNTSEKTEFATRPGSGPRHIEFHPIGKFVYLIEELSGNVSVFSYKNGQLKELQHLSAIRKGYTGDIGSADIHVSPDGRFVYASNRGQSNDLAIFAIHANTGKLTLAGHHSTEGKGPRNFNFDPSGKWLLAANQNSDQIVLLERNTKTGLLKDSGKRIELSKPVCIKWIK